MEDVIRAVSEQGVSEEQLLRIATDFGVQQHPEIQETLNQLLLKETSAVTPPSWTSAEADDLLQFLKSPEKTRPPLQVIQTDIQNACGPRGFVCDQCDKTFTQKRNLMQHVKSAHQKKTYDCSQCRKTFSRQTNLRYHMRQ